MYGQGQCCQEKGIALQARELIINNSTLSSRHPETRDRLLLVNYFGDITETISLKKVDVDMLNYLIKVVKGKRLTVDMNKSNDYHINRTLVSYPKGFDVIQKTN